MPVVGQSLSHYTILNKIGQGGMGEVFLAWDTSLERNVALKFLTEELRRDPVARERFRREAKSAATLDHPNICVVHEAVDAGGDPFIVMEYIEGESLRDRIARGPMPVDEALRVGVEIAEALSEAHLKRVVHRDLKPANVMVTRAGHVKVMDFGLAKRSFSTTDPSTEEQTLTELTRAGTTLGTLAYMSPEQMLSQAVDHRSDIFSFGTLLYEALTGVHPFRRASGMATANAIVNEDPAPPAEHAPAIPEPLTALVGRMLAKAPAGRPQSMRGVCEQLKQILLDEHAGAVRVRWMSLTALARRLRRPRFAILAIAALLALGFLGTRLLDYQGRVRWAREEALPEIERLLAANDVWRDLTPAYRLAEQAEAYIPNDPKLAELLSRCSLKMNVTTEPPGAGVYMKEYQTPDSDWSYLGVSPLEKVRVPIGIFRWKLEKDGYEPVLAVASTWRADAKTHDIVVPYTLERVLDRQGSTPAGMVRVPGGDTAVGRLDDFFIDRFEVTNRQFKDFIDAGGYRKREYWKHRFVRDGKEITWEEAVREFVDQTGQPGPGPWQAGGYPDGQDDYPVSGISWYEAAAYAEHVGKSLPTEAHWGRARGEGTPPIQVPQLGGLAVFGPLSNFRGKGPAPVGSLPSMTAYGASDMAGNVREWCWNETPRGRLLRGGAWDDNFYMFGNRSQAPPTDRSLKNGFRCALYSDPARVPAAAFEAAKLSAPVDFYKQEPAPDAIFQVYKEQFSYDRTDLKARVESRQESAGGWVQETVSFDAAYGGERVMAHLFLPRNTAPPYQTVIYFPGSASVTQRSSQNIDSYYEYTMFLSFIVTNGRAALYPVYKGTFERGDANLAPIHGGNQSRSYTEYLIQLVKDFRRSIDYLETRQDIDSSRLAYYGMSWGGHLGAIIPAVEERLKASVLIGGALTGRGRPEANQINYVTRVKTPTLMLNGKYDTMNPESVIRPMFDLLGTRDKQLVLDDTDHIPSTNRFIKETLAWLDRHLGPVK